MFQLRKTGRNGRMYPYPLPPLDKFEFTGVKINFLNTPLCLIVNLQILGKKTP